VVWKFFQKFDENLLEYAHTITAVSKKTCPPLKRNEIGHKKARTAGKFRISLAFLCKMRYNKEKTGTASMPYP